MIINTYPQSLIMDDKQNLSQWFKVILGLIIILVGIYLIVLLRYDVWTIIKGLAGPIIALIGLLIFMIGISDLKE